jgi:general stress protein CsbA
VEPTWIWAALLVVCFGYVAIETIIRRRVLETLLDVTLILASIALVLIVFQNFLFVVAIVVLAVGFVILRDNLRELRSSIG